MCSNHTDWKHIRRRTVAYVHLQSYMSIDWPREHAHPSVCHSEDPLPDYLRSAIDNLTRPLLQQRPGKDDFLERQFCTQTFDFIGSYGNCSRPLLPRTFQRWYHRLYDRRLSLTNRYTIGFILGTFLPSCICIFSSFTCLYYISNRPLIRKHSHSRAELRSLLLIFVEIFLSLMSVSQSYLINVFTCHGLLFRMGSDKCDGELGSSPLLNFLGSILELLTTTSNILILMICGSQFRNELIDILHLKRCFPKQPQHQSQSTIDESRQPRQKSDRAMPLRIILSAASSHNDTRRSIPISQDPSLDSLLPFTQNKGDNISMTETEQHSDGTSQSLMKFTAV